MTLDAAIIDYGTNLTVMTTAAAAAFVDPPVRTKRIAIVGFGSETMNEAPWEDAGCEIWILNMLHGAVPRWDRLFELHDRATVEQESDSKEERRKAERGGQRHIDYLRSVTDRPIYTTHIWHDVPCSVQFPVETVKNWLGEYCGKLDETPYFMSSFAYMLAWAVVKIVEQRKHEHVPEDGEEIHVCGVEMLNGEEYAYQRSNAEFLCGWVLGHGIRLHVPQRSALLTSDGMYGYAHAESLELLARMRAYYEDQIAKQKAKREAAAVRRMQAQADWNTADGVVQGLEWARTHILYLSRGGKV